MVSPILIQTAEDAVLNFAEAVSTDPLACGAGLEDAVYADGGAPLLVFLLPFWRVTSQAMAESMNERLEEDMVGIIS